MSTLEDKILGEKCHNYCSSSEESDSGDDEESDTSSNKFKNSTESSSASFSCQETSAGWDGTSKNTGPKGVLKDWELYKERQKERRIEQQLELAKQLSLTVQSNFVEKQVKDEDSELLELLDDEFLIQYQKERMVEMLKNNKSPPAFGKLVYLKNSEEFLNVIDKENKAVIVIVHIYEHHIEACRLMNECLEQLAIMHKETKFCAMTGSQATLSLEFKKSGLPAILVYKGGMLIGNFLRLNDDLGLSFYPEDVQEFLVQHGMIIDNSCFPAITAEDEAAGSE